MNGSRKKKERMIRMGNFWTKNDKPVEASTTTTVDPNPPPFVNYRATIVPDGTGTVYGKDKRSSVWEAVRWIKDYAEVNGVQDLKDAVGVIEEKLESIL